MKVNAEIKVLTSVELEIDDKYAVLACEDRFNGELTDACIYDLTEILYAKYPHIDLARICVVRNEYGELMIEH